MSSETRPGYEPRIDVNDVSLFNDLEMSNYLADVLKGLIPFGRSEFEQTFVQIGKNCERATGSPKQVNLILIGDEWGSEDEIVSNLRCLKGILEYSRMNKYIKDITVKSSNPNFESFEPNVFCSGVKFELLK